MRFVITGSSGYVGGAIVRFLRSRGDEVLELRRLREGEKPSPGIVPFSLGEQPDDERLRGADVLVHCAYDLKATGREEVFRTNVGGSQALLQGSLKLGIKRLILISSISAYEGCASLYGLAKMEIEHHFFQLGGVVVRPGLVYGDSPGGMMGRLHSVVEKLPVIPVIGGNQEMYLVHEEDLAAMTALIGALPKAPSTPLYACAERPVTFRAILEFLAENGGKKRFFFPVPWRGAWLALRLLEVFGLRPPFKSDSLLGMMKPNSKPEFGPTRALGLEFRDFAARRRLPDVLLPGDDRANISLSPVKNIQRSDSESIPQCGGK